MGMQSLQFLKNINNKKKLNKNEWNQITNKKITRANKK